ncbi:fido domain-containing protein [Cristinia sonorae]|uniref:Fido domain-containing protein n=1 Tax=Cristinia sonorae TaxID=1940300 RepID=A0A8K0UUN2_9AGAR|nr:fido domain-containing protein [Cristinia sonorae]
MRWSIDVNFSAIELYEKIASQCPDVDPKFINWIESVKKKISLGADAELLRYKSMTSQFSFRGQQWRSTTVYDDPEKIPINEPRFNLDPGAINDVRTQWNNLKRNDPPAMLAKYLSYHCVETQAIEGTVKFDKAGTTILVELGFLHQNPIHNSNILAGGEVTDRADAVSLLRDTYKTIERVYDFFKDDSYPLTPQIVCELHGLLMKSNRVLPALQARKRKTSHNADYPVPIHYTHIGRTRQGIKVNVTANTPSTAGIPGMIQFCPWDTVDKELSNFCERFNKLSQRKDADPFFVCAWTQHVFVTIHPFEDGNGRLSRILASIPLLRAGLPPLCIPQDLKNIYLNWLNLVREHRGTANDYKSLMEHLSMAVASSIAYLEDLGKNSTS